MGFKKWYNRQKEWVKWGLKGVLVNFILIWLIGFLLSTFESSFLVYITIMLHIFPTFLAGASGYCNGEGCLLYILFLNPIWIISIGFLGGVLTKLIINKFKKK